MKRFLSYIEERRTKLSSQPAFSGRDTVESISGAINPTIQELKGMLKRSKYDELRVFALKDGTLYAWDGDDALHVEVITGEGYYPNDAGVGVVRLLDNDVYWYLNRSGGRHFHFRKNTMFKKFRKENPDFIEQYG